jgi:hypothetical protein
VTRKAAIEAIKAAGARNDRKAFLRLYVENRISLAAANAAWREGERFGEYIRQRDSKLERAMEADERA